MTIDINATHSYANGDLALHYASVGPASGPIIVFLHSIGLFRHSWWDFALDLAPKGYRCFLLDACWHGKSDRAGGRYTRTDYTSDVIAFLDAVVRPWGKKCVLVGHLLSGLVLYEASAARPELVAGMLLEDPPIYMTHARLVSSPYHSAFKKLCNNCRACQGANLPVAHVQQLITASPIALGVPVTRRESLTEAALVAFAHGLLSLDPVVYDTLLSPDVMTINGDDKPSCVVAGILLRAQTELGPAFLEEDTERFRKAAPDVVEVKGAGHLIHSSRASRGAVEEALDKVLSAAFGV